MMPHWICAHYPDSSLILGNGLGQCIIRTRRPHLSRDWIGLGTPLFHPMSRAHHWTLQNDRGDILATKPNPNFKELN